MVEVYVKTLVFTNTSLKVFKIPTDAKMRDRK